MLQTVKGVTLSLKVLNVPFPLSFHSLAQLLYCILRNQARHWVVGILFCRPCSIANGPLRCCTVFALSLVELTSVVTGHCRLYPFWG